MKENQQGTSSSTPKCKGYEQESWSMEEAQRQAYLVALGPALFMVARILQRRGVLALLREHPQGVSEEKVLAQLALSAYAGRQLLFAGLCSGILLGDGHTYRISKMGWFLDNDAFLEANSRFMYDVNYRGFYHMEEALEQEAPVGLASLGEWSTLYEGLSSLPDEVLESWLAFDHIYSDATFDACLPLLFTHPLAQKAKKERGVYRLLDIGGNTGRWALRCVAYDAQVEVTVCDLEGQLTMMREHVAGKKGAKRITGYAINLLDEASALPSGAWDGIWMSQFLDCFSEEDGVRILQKVRDVMHTESRIYIVEPLWDRQTYKASSLCLTAMSLYFSVIANGKSGFFHSAQLRQLIEKAGLRIVNAQHGLGVGHTWVEVSL